MNLPTLTHVTAFLWWEADLLDHADYPAWLDLWTDDGLYIVPIDPKQTDFANTLNYAYDDREMRRKRVARLAGGESISALANAFTVRSVSRIRVLAESDAAVSVRAAQVVHEFKRGTPLQHVADVTFDLQRDAEGFRIQQKVVRLINSTDALTTVGFVF